MQEQDVLGLYLEQGLSLLRISSDRILRLGREPDDRLLEPVNRQADQRLDMFVLQGLELGVDRRQFSCSTAA